ncbi:hypothetical protein L1987_19056 [Smallanthus sonchifolius]|uniref:Uncharacterized protein n=1 Tax=Smallanthus sonchifolius TaxID=185202 RepID=A0ACB9J201_9ASTR|nr:hypothetical protein L1987_19056 [Smallanthus sonchifolius]
MNRIRNNYLRKKRMKRWLVHYRLQPVVQQQHLQSQKSRAHIAADGSNKSILETIDELTMEKENDDIENHVKHTRKSLTRGSNDTSTYCRNTMNNLDINVGHGNTDHYCWQRLEDMTTSRNTYKIDQNNCGSDLAGKVTPLTSKEDEDDFEHRVVSNEKRVA